MIPLEKKIIQMISKKGPIQISEYMKICMTDPEHGYYQTRKPFGLEGDFTTAPEISQIFGEIIAIWVISTWRQMSKPPYFLLCEAGPGRGTLMDDILRSLKKLVPEFLESAKIILIEKSTRLIEIQKKNFFHIVSTYNGLEIS
ncbi:MAG: methyltransferase [Candidatus Tokpelaia sp. JSC161]|jgi:SAM-dependent MidA family methyltransferase|nr:MAG: methyltransferase [Candidatus Tokpelaia sp. JSC161]